ncbi:MAG: hypothetical protein Q4A16_09090 [Lautropia sp.]|nr:hypothetical protein [Lautropia sp.]
MSKPSFKAKSLIAAAGLALFTMASPLNAQSTDAVCATPARMIADQGEGDAYMAGANPEWTWSHAGFATSALGGWDHWPAWEKARLPQFQHVHGDWSRLMPWFTVGGPAGSYSPATVEIGRMSVFYFSRNTQRWQLLSQDVFPEIGTCGAYTALTDCTLTSSPIATAYSPNLLHGWFDFVRIPSDAQALSVSIQARSVSGGRAMLSVGADYYPPDSNNLNGVAITAAGNSAPRYISSGAWTTVTFTTLADQTVDDTGISRDQLMSNAPACANPANS